MPDRSVSSAGNLEVHALASGSSGNAFLIRSDDVNLLIDAGLSARRIFSVLNSKGVVARNLDAILLTHEHTDHSSGIFELARRSTAPVIASKGTLSALALRSELPERVKQITCDETLGIGSLGIRAFPVSHDAEEPVGFVVETARYRMAYCTDLGCVTEHVREAVKGANLAVIEANHDINWLLKGSYTPEMKARVSSSRGHLSNDDCADLLAERLETGGPMTAWLAHLSRVNNSPSLARRSVSSRITQQTKTTFDLDIALRDHPSLVWRAGTRAIQLSLL